MKFEDINILKSVTRIVAFLLVFSLAFCMMSCENESVIINGNASNSTPTINQNGMQSGTQSGTQSGNSSHNSSGKKRVAITYDDGPHNVNTVNIVDELAKYGFSATFFVVGNRISGPEYNGAKAMKYAASKGNEIAIHGFTHLQDKEHYYDTCSESIFRSELGDTKSAILAQVPNAKIKLMRPVGGKITAERVQSCGYSVIMWSVDSNDWRYKSSGADGVSTIVNNVMSQVQNGSIILMHDIYENTYLATKEILKQLNAQGYEVVTVSELLGNPQAGVKYSKA